MGRQKASERGGNKTRYIGKCIEKTLRDAYQKISMSDRLIFVQSVWSSG